MTTETVHHGGLTDELEISVSRVAGGSCKRKFAARVLGTWAVVSVPDDIVVERTRTPTAGPEIGISLDSRFAVIHVPSGSCIQVRVSFAVALATAEALQEGASELKTIGSLNANRQRLINIINKATRASFAKGD